MEKQAIDVAKALVRLSEVTIFELRGEWRRLHRMPPPMRLSRDLLIRGIIYQLQERALSGVSSKISLNSRSHLQHFQRPTSSHFCKDAPSLSRVGYEHVARGSRGRLKIFGTQNSRVLLSTK